MPKPFRIGIAGLGTVGTGVVKILQTHADLLALRAGRPLEIVSVTARDKNRERGVDLSAYAWVEKPEDLISTGNIDAVVELIGGSEGVALDLVRGALEGGLHVVTANKALLAHHGFDLAVLAEAGQVSLAYEAAVAGGIPIIKAMREGLAANDIRAVYGILNGTCNYILSQMRETGRDFAAVLKEAQEQGYAEADPAFDVDGIDAGHKLCLLTSLAFGVQPDFRALKIQGIRQIHTTDIDYATELGYRVKLLGIARRIGEQIMQVMEPCLVPTASPLGAIEDVYNAVYVEADFVETPLFAGKGAGAGPTASSVVADLIDLARGFVVPTFGVPAQALQKPQWVELGSTTSRYYLRLNVLDQPGVIADISAILRDFNISIGSLMQHGHDPGQPVPVVLISHETKQADMTAACEKIAALACSVEEPCLMRIVEL